MVSGFFLHRWKLLKSSEMGDNKRIKKCTKIIIVFVQQKTRYLSI